jgi:hypothetical protein
VFQAALMGLIKGGGLVGCMVSLLR